jgi:hypothetical protein
MPVINDSGDKVADPDYEVRSDPHSEQEVHVHLPNPSYYPILAAFGLFLFALGLLIDNPELQIGNVPLPVVTLVGIVTLIGGIVGWSFEPAD